MATKMDERLNQEIDHYYNMNHKNRGLAVIFNHEEFDDSDWSVRYGTRVDCDNLKTTFTALNFNVRVHEDQTKSEMKNILQNVAAEDHSDNDCLVVILLTHGELLPKNVYNPAYNSAVNEEGNTILSHDLVSYIRTKDTSLSRCRIR
ncbi:caspase-1-like isoform X2 [Sitodiplosis mosellana]|uniref:caspase-1-like isoform X2 n=1 Tax=Sitodiplosis mosellana TaxID=263140 RepID=UPI002444310C|nr:caspase-1-like isoform X2 [Sitodiplosis mosellana]